MPNYPQRRDLPATDRKLWSMLDAASALGITRRHLYTLVERGDIRTVSLGRRRLVTDDELQRFVDALTAQAS